MGDASEESKAYHGSCQCGAFKFKIEVPQITAVFDCNCSICVKKGYKWVFPGTTFVIEEGEDLLATYEYGACTIAHKFCPTCGVGIFAKRHIAPEGQNLAVNANTLYDLDVSSLKMNPYDGAAIPPIYTPPTVTAVEPTPCPEVENAKLYTGACHCGSVSLAVKTRGPLSVGKEVVKQCKCSYCQKNNIPLLHAPTSHLPVSITKPLTSYNYGQSNQSNEFCPICSVSVLIRRNTGNETVPVNLKCFEGVEWSELEIESGKGKGSCDT